MKKSIYSFFAMLVIATLMFSCKEDSTPPIVEMFFEVDETDAYKVSFTTTDKDVTSYAWDFGDGEKAPNQSLSTPISNQANTT